MTPCSAAAGGSFSSRESSRSAALRASSGSSASSIRSRSLVGFGLLLVALPQLVLDRFHLLAQEELALAFVDLRLHLGLDLAAELDHLELAGEDLGEVAQAPHDLELLQQLLLLLGRDPQGAGDQVGQRRRVVEVGDRHLQLLGQIGDLLDDLREGALHVAGQRLQLGAVLDHVGKLIDPRHQVGLLGDVGAEANPLCALDEDAQGAVGDLEHAGDDADHADLVEVLGAGLVVLGIESGDHRQHPVGAEHVVDQLDRPLLAHRQRGQGLGEGDGLAQGQDRQRIGQRLAGADRVFGVERIDHLEHRAALHQYPPSRSGPGASSRPDRAAATRSAAPRLRRSPSPARRRRRPAARRSAGTAPRESPPAGRPAPRSPAPAVLPRSPTAAR